jgi:hypothetical protein
MMKLDPVIAYRIKTLVLVSTIDETERRGYFQIKLTFYSSGKKGVKSAFDL